MKNLIKKADGASIVSCTLISAEFGLGQGIAMQKIRSLIESRSLSVLDFKEIAQVDKSNRAKPSFDLTELGFLMETPFAGGVKAREGEVTLIDRFIRMRDVIKRDAAIKAER